MIDQAASGINNPSVRRRDVRAAQRNIQQPAGTPTGRAGYACEKGFQRAVGLAGEGEIELQRPADSLPPAPNARRIDGERPGDDEQNQSIS